jgi:hypothetical protein
MGGVTPERVGSHATEITATTSIRIGYRLIFSPDNGNKLPILISILDKCPSRLPKSLEISEV